MNNVLELAKYLEAKKKFLALLDELLATARALKQSATRDEVDPSIVLRADPALGSLLHEKHAELLRLERETVVALRGATGRPYGREVLLMACEEAEVAPPSNPDYEQDWLDARAREAPQEKRQMARGYLQEALRFAANDRLLSASCMLERFKKLLSK